MAKKLRLPSEYMDAFGDNAKIAPTKDAIASIGYAKHNWKLKPVDLNDPLATKKRIDKYLTWCQDNDRIPQPIGLANFLGVSRKTMNEWKAGTFSGLQGEAVVQKALMYLEEIWYEQFMQNKQFATPYIFIAKNWYGYKDAQDIQVGTVNPLGDLKNEAELRKRIESDIVIDVEPTAIKDADDAEPQKGTEE